MRILAGVLVFSLFLPVSAFAEPPAKNTLNQADLEQILAQWRNVSNAKEHGHTNQAFVDEGIVRSVLARAGKLPEVNEQTLGALWQDVMRQVTPGKEETSTANEAAVGPVVLAELMGAIQTVKPEYFQGGTPPPGREDNRKNEIVVGPPVVVPNGGSGNVPVMPVQNPQHDNHRFPRGSAMGDVNQYLASNFPMSPMVWMNLGRQDMDARDYRGAFDKYSRAVRLNRKDPNALFGYGSAAMNLGDTRLAAQAADQALQIDPAHKGALTLLKLSEGRSPTVNLPNVLDASAKGGTFAMTPNAGAAALPQMSGAAPTMTAEQIAAALQSQAAAPPSAVQQSAAVTQQGMAAMAVRDYSQAKGLFTQAVDLNGRNAEAYNGRAIAENKLGEYGDAINDASFALGLVPGNDTALQTRSWAFAQSGRYQDALADANYSLERDPSNAYAFYNRAFALAGLQDREGAIESLHKASKIDQRFKPTYEEALQAPKDSDLLFLFADVGVKKGEPASAPEPGSRDKRFLKLVVVVLMGGGLVGLGMLHVFSPRWRQTVYGTIRRMVGGGASEETAEGADGFWNGYTVLREIAAGGMGVVYEATDNALARRVAIKKMRDEIRNDPEERRRFLTEARTVATLHHPNIADIYSIVEDSGDVYLVFEYVDGKTACDFLDESGPLALPDAKRVMKEACAAVDYAHAQGIIHRDLKPSNIMLASNGGVKVMDFGVARQAAEAINKAAQTNTIVGTPPYMAPEQEQGTVRRESDIFALGVCFYELVSGKLPFAGQGAGMLLNKMNGKHIPLSGVAAGLPAGTDEVVAKALDPDPEKRYRTAGDFAAALQSLPG